MTNGDTYRAKATEFEAGAKVETNPKTRDELESLALAYRRLAQQADQNDILDISIEFPARNRGSDEEPSAK